MTYYPKPLTMISSMNKLCVVLTVLIITCVHGSISAQNVKYYKLVSINKNGVANKKVSGGQFITFVSDICFESNNKGVGVNHGTLKRNNNYSNSQHTVYQGSSYWGENTTFKFNTDKSMLNVVLDKGDIYVYKRATPPAGVTTCSLIRKKSSGGGGTDGGYTPMLYPIPQYPPQQYPQQQNQQKKSLPEYSPQQQKKLCKWCNGTKRIEKNDGFTIGLGEKIKCRECGKTVLSSHYHADCPYCHGTGYE